MAKKHHAITFSVGTGVGVGGMATYFLDKISELINAPETTEACTELLQSLI